MFCENVWFCRPTGAGHLQFVILKTRGVLCRLIEQLKNLIDLFSLTCTCLLSVQLTTCLFAAEQVVAHRCIQGHNSCLKLGVLRGGLELEAPQQGPRGIALTSRSWKIVVEYWHKLCLRSSSTIWYYRRGGIMAYWPLSISRYASP